MSGKSNTAISRYRSHHNFNLMSPKTTIRSKLLQSPRLSSPTTTLTSFPSPSRHPQALQISKIPLHQMFLTKTPISPHSPTLIPDNLYHPPKSSFSLRKSPKHSFPKTKNKSFINLIQEHSKKIPAPTAYSKKMNWINNTARDLSKGGMRKTVIDQRMEEGRKLPSPDQYEVLGKRRVKGAALDKARGFHFLSETQHLSERNPSPGQYEIKEGLVMKKVPQYKIIKAKGNGMGWKPAKKAGASVGSYEISTNLVTPKSPRAIFNKEKLRSMIQNVTRNSKKVPGVGEYTITPCYNKISRPMRSSRV